jgi:hypothetical protein
MLSNGKLNKIDGDLLVKRIANSEDTDTKELIAKALGHKLRNRINSKKSELLKK